MSQERLEYLRKKKRLAELREKKAASVAQPMAEEESALETAGDFARGIGQGASLGFVDELTGVAGAAFDPNNLRDKASSASAAAAATQQAAMGESPQATAQAMAAEGFSPQEIANQLAFLEEQKQKQIPNIYTVYRDKARKLDEAARQRSPIAMGAGELVGAIGTGGAAGVRSIPALMGEGALYGFGSSEGEALNQLKDAGEGALTALIAGGAGKGLEKLGGKITSWLGKKGQKKAVEAIAPTTKQAKNIDKEKIGKTLLDEGIVGPGKKADDMLAVTKEKLFQYGDELDSMYQNFGGMPADKRDLVTSLWKSANKVEKEATANKPIARQIRDFAKDLSKRDTILSPSQIRKEKQALDKIINWQSDAPSQEAKKIIRGTFNQAENNLYKTIDGGKEFTRLKDKMSSLSKIDDILENTAGRQTKKTGFQKLMDTGLLAGGGYGASQYSENPEILPLIALIAGSRKLGPGGGAKALDVLSKARMPIPAGTTGRAINALNFYGDEP